MNPYRLYMVTDDQQDITTLKKVVAEAVAGGVTMVQVREKHGDVQAFIQRAEAVKAVRQFPYDLVLMDVQMPGMDGREATVAIRGLPAETGRIPIVGLSADSVTGVREQCLAAGMDDYLTKPIDMRVLRGALQQWVAEAA